MAQSDLDLVRDLYAEFAAGRFGSRPDRWSPDIEFKRIGADAGGVDLGGEWHGIPAMVGAIAEWFDVWEDMTIEAEEIIEPDDGGILVLTRRRARAKASGMELDARGTEVMWLRGGRVAAFHSYWYRDEGLRAFGRDAGGSVGP